MFATLRTRFQRRMREWAKRRQGPDGRRITIAQRRLYILPTPQGFLFGLTLLVMLLGSMNYANSMGFMLTFLLFSLAVLSMHAAHANLLGLELVAASVEPVFAGDTARFHLAVHNPGRRARVSVTLSAEDDERTVTSDIPAAGQNLAPVPLATRQRGWQPMGRLAVESSYPFGLFRPWSWIYMDWKVLVYPAPAPQAPPLPEPLGGQGLGRPNQLGEDDFGGLRQYQRGDSPRRIAWKASTRHAELLTKRFSGTGEQTRWFEWTALEGLDEETRLSVLCQWILTAHAAGMAYGMKLPGAVFPPGSGEEQRDRCLQALALFGTEAK
ncbi:MAG TPA: DUF58 domain-containing protein [Gammaproteobacteria bacterium]|jgi:uncharacterized protein (DUF58 family)